MILISLWKEQPPNKKENNITAFSNGYIKTFSFFFLFLLQHQKTQHNNNADIIMSHKFLSSSKILRRSRNSLSPVPRQREKDKKRVGLYCTLHFKKREKQKKNIKQKQPFLVSFTMFLFLDIILFPF